MYKLLIMPIDWNYALKMNLNINEMSYHKATLKEKPKILTAEEIWLLKF